MNFQDNLRGIVAMLVCCLLFILNDTMVKYGSQDLPLGELLLVRSVIATSAVALFAWWRGSLRRIGWCLTPPVLLRAVGDGAATVLYGLGLIHMPIANCSAIGQVTPLAITAAGAVLLGEAVGWRRWLSVAVGFAGILLIVRPGGAGFNVWSLSVLLAVVALVVRDLSTRFVGKGGDTTLVVLANLVAVTLVTATMSMFETWKAVDAPHLAVILASGVFLIGGLAFSVEAMLHGDVSLIAPFRYSFVLYALLIGFVVWGDVPDEPTLAGIAVVVGSGVYVVYRERVVARRRAAASG